MRATTKDGLLSRHRVRSFRSMYLEDPLPTAVAAARRRVRPVWLALLSLTPFIPASAQQRPRRVEPAGIPVRFTEGSVHGFMELQTAAGALLAPGDLTQAVENQGVVSRMVFH